MQTCMLTCVAVIQGVESVFMGWSIHGKNFFDGHIRYRKSEDIMMTGVQHIVTSNMQLTWSFPRWDSNPEPDSWSFSNAGTS